MVSPTTLVTTTVWMADEPIEEMAFATAAVFDAAGQFVTEAAQEMTVCIFLESEIEPEAGRVQVTYLCNLNSQGGLLFCGSGGWGTSDGSSSRVGSSSTAREGSNL